MPDTKRWLRRIDQGGRAKRNASDISFAPTTTHTPPPSLPRSRGPRPSTTRTDVSLRSDCCGEFDRAGDRPGPAEERLEGAARERSGLEEVVVMEGYVEGCVETGLGAEMDMEAGVDWDLEQWLNIEANAEVEDLIVGGSNREL